MKHIYLDKLFLLFLVIIIITGNFNTFIPYFALLMIHELGHALAGIVLGYQLDRISIYPYGGITSFNLPLNIPLKEELFILIMGPMMQIIGYLILKNIFYDISILHYALLFFNLLPIYPLDGGKILNVFCNYYFNYLRSFNLTLVISLMFIIGLFAYNFINFNLNLVLMLIFLVTKIYDVYHKRFYYYNRFLLERYLHHYSFSKFKYIDNIKKFYRDTKHMVNYQNEEYVLKKLYQNK